MTVKIKVYTLNAFAKTSGGGNPAGIVLDADSLTEQEMQYIAGKVGFSETAFLRKSDAADFKVQFFTPVAEVDLCGHATIAAFSLLAQTGVLKPGSYTQQTKAGLLAVSISSDNTIYMNQNIPDFLDIADKKEIADSLNITEDTFMSCPARIVSTGLKDIIVPVKTLKQLTGIKPDFNKIIGISRKYNAVGYHLFTLETINSSTAHCRNFAPLYDIPEEAATGTSSGALSSYLYHYGLVSESEAAHMVFEQGYCMKRTSEILASLTLKDKRITEVRIGGIARDIDEIEIDVSALK